jgi:hypothetical protein
MWEAVTVVIGYPDDYNICWIAGLWSTQVKVEGIMLKAAWHLAVIAVLQTIRLLNQAAPHCM